MTKKFETGFLLSGISLHFINVRVSMGATVIANMDAPIRENVLVRTNGENSLRSCPVRNKIGAKDMTIIKTEKNTERPTVLDDSSIMATRSASGISLVCPMRSFILML